MTLRSLEPESNASASSAMPAYSVLLRPRLPAFRNSDHYNGWPAKSQDPFLKFLHFFRSTVRPPEKGRAETPFGPIDRAVGRAVFGEPCAGDRRGSR